MAEPIASAVAPLLVNPSVGFAEKHIGYVWNYKKNIAELKRQVDKLDAQRDDTSHSVTAAQNNAEKIKTRVEIWLDGACKTSQEAREILQEYEALEKNMCSTRCCPNPISLYQLGKRACKIVLEITEAMTEAGQINAVSVRAVGQGTDTLLSTKGLLNFESRKSTLEDIMKTLQDETKNTIGVYGLGGMGKTTLAKQVASQVTKEKMFEEVVMASVTQKVDMKEIQGQIASMLDLKLEESSVAERASRIRERLKGKKVLVVLDDLWTELDLIQVGIPLGEEHMGCKILLISRSRRVLYKMNTTKEYDIGALKEEEAWRLFEEKVSHIVKNTKFLTVGKEVAKRCAGLPILIVTVAGALANQPHLEAWNDTLAQVKKMDDKNMHDIVNSAIESISYECLNEIHKRLFLLCGLMQGDAVFEDILRYSLGWDLFGEDAIVTVEGARNRLHALIFDLKASCLLLDSNVSDRIKMHDVVRDVAISIARKDLNAFSIRDNDTELPRWPKNDVLKKYTAMVFGSCRNLPSFPQRLECPSLELFIFLAFSMDSKLTIPDTFFERTSKLKVLDMSALCFPTLPSTLSFLKNLQSLHLDYCEELQDISIVGELKKLQVLSLVGSTIQELPSSLGQLSELKLLDLNSCSKLKVIPSGLISGLSQLEELHMSGSFNRWKSEECLNSSGRSNASFAELKFLPNLSCLKVELGNAKLLPADLNFENLKRYEIIGGDMWDQSFRHWFENLKIKTIIALQLGTNSINHLQHVVNTLFKRTECLCLGEVKGINNVIPELNEDGFPELEHLYIIEDSEIQYIVNVEDKQHKASFPALESLHLSGLRKVEKICNAGLMEGSFCNLTIVKVQDCNRLESLFSFSTIIALPCLQEIGVFSCAILKEIVAKKRKEDDDVNRTGDVPREKIEIAQLCKLALKCVPKFMTFFNGENIPMVKRRQQLLTRKIESEDIIADEGEIIAEEGGIIAEEGESASSLPLFEEVSFPKLEELELYGMSNLTEIWSHKLLKVAYCNLTTLIVTCCDNLKYLLSPSIAMDLEKVQRLTVRNCSTMKAIVGNERGKETIDRITFPQLIHLSLDDLPTLRRFYSRVEEMDVNEKLDSDVQPLFTEKIQFPKLEKLNVYRLDNINTIWQSQQLYEVNSFCKLEELRVTSCASLLNIVPSTKTTTTKINLNSEFQENLIFQNLSEVTVDKCESLKYVFPASMAKSLNQLKTVRIKDCGIETIIGDDEDEELKDVEEQVTKTFTFSNLATVDLCRLPKYSQDPSFIPNILDRLENLRVTECHRLTNLVPPSASFRLLMYLILVNCGGLINLLQPSTATSLEQLELLSISGCEMMEEVIGVVRDNDQESSACHDHEIVFNKLGWLKLRKLPRLTGFCSSRNYTFNFPKLEVVKVIECPNMKTFCGGTTTTPQLKRLYLTDFPSEKRWEGELNTTVKKIYEEREAERLATTLQSILASNHSEARAREEMVAYSYRSKGKEVEVSDPSCSNYIDSSTQSSPQISNHSDEVNHLATQVEALTPAVTIARTSSNDQFEAQAQIHDMSPEESIVEPEKESHILRNCIEELENKEYDVCESVTTGPRKETETSDQVVEMEARGLTITLPSTSSSGPFEQEIESHEKSIEELTKATKEGRISMHAIDELENEYEFSEKTTKLENEFEFRDNAIEPKQVTKLSSCLVTKAETENFIPLIRESFRALGARPMSSFNAEQVHFVNYASDWLSAFAKKVTKCVERKYEISNLKREIAEKESKLRALQDEDEDGASSSSMPSFV